MLTNSLLGIDFDAAILEYVRNEKGERIGMVMAAPDRLTNSIRIGWSMVQSNSEDTFNKKLAWEIAWGRVELADFKKVTIPFDIYQSGLLDRFVFRAMKYYRTDNVEVFGRVRTSVNNKIVHEAYKIPVRQNNDRG